MMFLPESIQKAEYEFDRKAERFFWRHPVLGFLSIFIGMPILILICVCVSTVAILFTIAWLMGWL